MQRDETSSGQRERLLLALLAGRTPEEAAADAGVSRATAWRWRRGPKFKRRLEQARRETLRAGLDRVVAGLTEAVDTLRKNLHCGVPQAANAAASRLLEIALTYQEQFDLVDRIAALETRLNNLPEDEPWTSKPA